MPFCARATGVTRELGEQFGERLRYVFRHLPLTDAYPHAGLAARAAVAADRQGQFWPMHDLLFAHQDQLEFEDLAGYADQAGLDVEVFLRALDDDSTADRVRLDVEGAEASGGRGTPTFFVNGRRHTGAHDARALASALEQDVPARSDRKRANRPCRWKGQRPPGVARAVHQAKGRSDDDGP